MKGFLVFFPMAVCLCATAGEFTGNETEPSVEQRRAEATGNPMETFRTQEGKIYRDVVITKIDAGGVSFKHADGVARLRHDDLSPGQREYFGIDQETAAELYRKEAEQRAAYERKVAIREEERRVLAKKEAEELAEIRRMELESAATASALAEAHERERVAETIPSVPTIKRVDSGVRRARSYYDSYNPFYRGNYGYPRYSGYSPYRHYGVRFGSFTCSPRAIVIWR